MNQEMQALYRFTVSDSTLSALFRQKATENAATMIASLFDTSTIDVVKLDDDQISQLEKPKSFAEIRKALQAIMRGRNMTVAELSQMSVFGRIKKKVRREFIRQNLYKMEKDGQAERIGTKGRSTIWRLS